MSAPGDPFDPSLPQGFGQRDPNFQPAAIFAEADRYVEEIYSCLVNTDLAWSEMKECVENLADAANQLHAVSEGDRDRDIVDARSALSHAVHQVMEARLAAAHGYDRGLAYLRAITDQ